MAPMSGGSSRLIARFNDPERRIRPEFTVRGPRLYFTITEFDGDVWVMELLDEAG